MYFGENRTCFNSKMVRLIVKKENISKVESNCFNSKMVRLIVWRDEDIKKLDSSFNSKMVRLIGAGRDGCADAKVVSIPKWFD